MLFRSRLCVSMSRQKKSLAIFGDSDMVTNPLAKKNIEALVNFYDICNSTHGKILEVI